MLKYLCKAHSYTQILIYINKKNLEENRPNINHNVSLDKELF